MQQRSGASEPEPTGGWAPFAPDAAPAGTFPDELTLTEGLIAATPVFPPSSRVSRYVLPPAAAATTEPPINSRRRGIPEPFAGGANGEAGDGTEAADRAGTGGRTGLGGGGTGPTGDAVAVTAASAGRADAPSSPSSRPGVGRSAGSLCRQAATSGRSPIGTASSRGSSRPTAWIAAGDSAGPAAGSRALDSGSGPCAVTAWVSEGPVMYAVAGHGVSASASASTNAAVRKPPIRRIAAISPAKRRRKCGSAASSACTVLTATSRPPGDRAGNTCPMPPAPSRPSTANEPIHCGSSAPTPARRSVARITVRDHRSTTRSPRSVIPRPLALLRPAHNGRGSTCRWGAQAIECRGQCSLPRSPT